VQLRREERILRHFANIALKLIAPGDRRALPRSDIDRKVGAGNVCRAFHHCYGRGIIRVACNNLVAPGSADLNRTARRVDCDKLARWQTVELKEDSTLCFRCNKFALVECRHVELRRLVHDDTVVSDFDGRGGQRLCPEPFATGDRKVERHP
jgi:hypothetical protein